MKTIFFAGLLLLVAGTCQAQKTEIAFDPVDGPPCVARRLDMANAQRLPIQRSIYTPRVTRLKAVIVAGSGRRSENLVISNCAEQAKRELDSSRSSLHSKLFGELYSNQVRECIARRDPALRVYDIHFARDDRCVSTPSE